jgi:hypothetical protein
MVMVLQKCDQSRGGQRRRGFAAGSAAAKRRGFALIREALGERAAEMRRRLCRIVSVETHILTGDQHMQGMVQVIVPLRGVGHGLLGIACQISGFVAIVFEDEMDFAVGDTAAHGLGEFR